MKNRLELGGIPFLDKPMWAVVSNWVMLSIFAKVDGGFAWSRYRSSETRGTWQGVSFETIGSWSAMHWCHCLVFTNALFLCAVFCCGGKEWSWRWKLPYKFLVFRSHGHFFWGYKEYEHEEKHQGQWWWMGRSKKRWCSPKLVVISENRSCTS